MTATRKGHVLIEGVDSRATDAQRAALEAAGFSVTVCPGADALRYRLCPLLSGEPCPWIDAADVVLHDLDPDLPEHRAVLHAVRRIHRDVPVVLEVPEETAWRHADTLTGCHTVYPFDMDRLVQAVDDAARARVRQV